jgi:hypothetical protein
MEPIPEFGDLMLAEEFAANVQCGAFIPYDGDGTWATETTEDVDSNVWKDQRPEWATHVVWYNR